MRLGRKMDDRARPVFRQHRIHQRAVADVAAEKYVAGVAVQGGEVFQIARVSQLVEVNDRLARSGYPVEHEVGADKPGAAGDENHFAYFLPGNEGRIITCPRPPAAEKQTGRSAPRLAMCGAFRPCGDDA